MPILFCFDLETTGLDFVKDRPIEVGAILYSTNQHKCVESQGFLVKSDVLISKEITELTGITQQAVNKFGYESVDSLDIVLYMMGQADAVLGHNAVRFDRNMLVNWAGRHDTHVPDKLWIDTYTDLPGAKPGTLTHMAADHGILNLFPHSALADCQTCLKLFEQYDVEKVVERAKSPVVVVQARVTFDTNHLAKKERFRWYSDRKMWWRFMKEMDIDAFAKDAPFDITIYRDNIQEFLDL